MARGADRLSHSDELTSRAHLLREEGGAVRPSHGEDRSAARLHSARRRPEAAGEPPTGRAGRGRAPRAAEGLKGALAAASGAFREEQREGDEGDRSLARTASARDAGLSAASRARRAAAGRPGRAADIARRAVSRAFPPGFLEQPSRPGGNEPARPASAPSSGKEPGKRASQREEPRPRRGRGGYGPKEPQPGPASRRRAEGLPRRRRRASVLDTRQRHAVTRGVRSRAAGAAARAVTWRPAFVTSGFGRVLAAACAAVVPLLALMMLLLALLSQAPAVDEGYEPIELPPAVEAWRPTVAEACRDLGVGQEWVDLALAMMAQESGGNLLVTCYNGAQIQDIMQACEGAYSSWILTGAPEYGCAPRTARASVYAGVAEMRDNLESWHAYLGDFGPGDLGAVKLVVQGYNYGAGFLPWCSRHGVTEWTLESSQRYSDMMAVQTGWGYYGTPNHALLVMRYYPYRTQVGAGKQAVVEAALMVAESYATPYVYGGNSITQGCDCSYFTMWCYQQAAGISIPRQSELQRDAGTCIPIEQAEPGDLVWMQGHIGIYLDEGHVVEQTPPYCRVNPITYNRWVCAVRIDG